jgi:hypothetical protein
MDAMTRRSMIDRMKGAARLDVHTYEEVEADSSATGQAAVVVVLVAVAQGIGAAGFGARGLIGGAIAALVGWLLWAGITYLIGDKLLGGTATWGELLRTIGFAQTPGLLMILAIVPVLRGPVVLAVSIWVLIAGVIAIRQALDFGTGKAVVTTILGWLVIAIPRVILGIGSTT